MKKTDLLVVKKPIEVVYECPFCKESIEVEYSSFCDAVGEPCDWRYGKFNCFKCNEEIEVDSIDWD